MEKTVLINCSPKRKLSVSGFLMRCAGILIRGKKEYLQLRTPADRQAIIQALKTAGKVIFVTPLYVDSLPSHMLPFMREMEAFCRENGLRLKVYVIANNGFIEGKQNEPLMQVMENFCVRSGLDWCGGIGIGGGVMLNVTRILFLVQFAILLLNIALSAANTGSFFPESAWIDFGKNTALLLLFNLGVLFYLIRMGFFLRKGGCSGRKYTRILLPSFVFILFADIFFIIISVFEGGIFRGWLAKKLPEES